MIEVMLDGLDAFRFIWCSELHCRYVEIWLQQSQSRWWLSSRTYRDAVDHRKTTGIAL